MLVELKNGETLNGHLVTCDNWMNLILREVVQTSPEGDKFFKLPEVYIRGNNVSRLPMAFCSIEPLLGANHRSRSNTCASQKKLSSLSRNSNRINLRTDVAETVVATEVVVVDVEDVAVGGDVVVVVVRHEEDEILWTLVW